MCFSPLLMSAALPWITSGVILGRRN
uniref:Uncharacterized protein n=1 Tax=Arundo donax TaxID=35708 RepID=A0A0A9HLE1_ARUDO